MAAGQKTPNSTHDTGVKILMALGVAAIVGGAALWFYLIHLQPFGKAWPVTLLEVRSNSPAQAQAYMIRMGADFEHWLIQNGYTRLTSAEIADQKFIHFLPPSFAKTTDPKFESWRGKAKNFSEFWVQTSLEGSKLSDGRELIHLSALMLYFGKRFQWEENSESYPDFQQEESSAETHEAARAGDTYLQWAHDYLIKNPPPADVELIGGKP